MTILRVFLLLTTGFSALVFGQTESAKDYLIILNKNEAQLVLVDGRSLDILAKIQTGDYPHEVAVSKDGKTAYVANYGA